MKIEKQDYNDVTVISLQGEFDVDSTELLQRMVTDIISESKNGVVIDFSNVEFIDSAGLEQLLWTRDYCDENMSQLRISGLNENCREILYITHLDGEFDCYSELADAVKSFA
jgi:anti-sigma B factor antagonist